MNELGGWLESLWAPWRIEYLERERRPDFLREAAEAANDADYLVVCRRKNAFLMMNLYPYAPGHLMVVPYRMVSRLGELVDGEKIELLDLASYAERLLEDVVKAEGFNVGWNIGAAAGAGVTDYLHLHVVPRTKGDGLKGFFWPRRKYASDEAAAAVAARIREVLATLPGDGTTGLG